MGEQPLENDLPRALHRFGRHVPAPQAVSSDERHHREGTKSARFAIPCLPHHHRDVGTGSSHVEGENRIESRPLALTPSEPKVLPMSPV
jgi:hypothetical protein